MKTQRLDSRLSSQWRVSTLRLIVTIGWLLSASSLQASHQTTTSTQPGQSGSAQPQAAQKPTKPGAGETASAMSSGIGASVGGFNIQSFNADLFTGTAGSEIPIAVPPGAAGVAPKITLRYNSGVIDDIDGDQADWTGLGWSLDTGGFVIRNTKGTTSTADDTFQLVFGGDTHDLVAIGAGNYRTRDETFLAITYVTASDYWTVKTKDGTVHRFGFSASSRATGLTFALNVEVPVTFRYFLDEVTTTSGVGVRYEYFKQSSSYNGKAYDQAVYPDKIKYAYRNNSLVGTIREVTFIRGNRTDWTNVSASQHTSYHDLYRLDAIEVTLGASLVRRYNFSYDYSIDRDPNVNWGGGAAGDLTLKSVTTLGSDGVSALPVQTFSYGDSVLTTINNGIGGSVSLLYEKLSAQLWATEGLRWNSNQESYDCSGSVAIATSYEVDCYHQALVATSPPVGTVPIYKNVQMASDPESSTPSCGSATGLAASPGPCDYSVYGYASATPTLTATVPLYNAFYLYWNSSQESYDCSTSPRFTTDTSGSCSTPQLIGYVPPGTIDKSRRRVISRTANDGRGWSATTTYHYFNPATGTNPLDFQTEFRGHAKVRSVDPIGNYTDTFFYQDDIKKGRAFQTEVRSAAGALYNKTVNTFLTTNPYPGVTFIRLDRSDYFECEGQATCHQNAETFTYDSYGNPTQKVDLGDVPTTGDERTQVTEWIVDTANWIHRPKRTALLDNTGATVRESWTYYDNAAYGILGTRGLPTKTESRLAGAQGNSGNPTATSGYDVYGNRTSVTDARGCTTNTVFEASQTYPATVTNCLNHSSTMVYDAGFGVMTSQTDANGQTSTTTYDVFGRPTKVTGPLDGASTYGTASTFYDDWGNPNLQKVRSYRTEQHGTANYIWSETYFDGLGREYKSQNEGPGGQTVVGETLFDSRGMQWKSSAPRFTAETAVWTETLYDVLGRQIRVNFPDGTFALTAYDHHEVTATDPRGKIKRTYTDSHHRVSQVEEVNGATSYFTNYFYDAADSLIKVTNAAGHNTHNVYDFLGRKVAMCDPNMGTLSSLTICTTATPGAWVYTYNIAGDMLTQKDAKIQTLTFTYDLLGRPLTKQQGTTSLVTWTYDDVAVLYSKGRVTQIVDQAMTTKFVYDQLGRTTQTQRLQLGVWKTMAQSYDALSRITSETFPDSEVVTYGYNSAGWLNSVPGYVNDIQYNSRGQKTSLTYGNGLVTTWTHNATNFRVTNRTTSSNQQNLTYAYDPNGNVTAITDSLFTGSRSFTYDDLGRMITGNGTFGVNQAQTSCSYTYSSIGNLTNKCGAVLSYGDANHPSAVTNHSTLAKNYTYDANGNMLTRGSQTLAWTIDNRVASVTLGASTTSMEYDYSGMRVKKTAPAGVTLYPFMGYEIDPNGVVTKFIRAGGESIASKKGTAKYFYHNDHLGSVNMVTDITGMRVQLNEYDPWGAVSRASGNVDPDTRFTGQKLDPETGLYFYNGRYYDNEIGRFISADPFIQTPFDPQNLNRYSYVINNPQNYVDPDGYFHQPKKKKGGFFKSWLGTIIGAIVTIVTYGAGSAITFGTALSYGLAAKSIVDGGMNGGALGALTGAFTAAAYAYGGVFAGQFAEGISAEVHGGNFWKAYLKAGWQPYASFSGEGSILEAGQSSGDFGIRTIYGETSGLYPQLRSNPPVPRSGVYNARNWNGESLDQLQSARSDIAQSVRNGARAHQAGPPSRNDRLGQQQWELAIDASRAVSDLPKDVRHFFLRAETGPQRPWFVPEGAVPYRSYGPFVNPGGGDVPISTQVYIDFYRGIK